ncbi:unnamed protein product [Echinostoma caproni]|uniref:Vesicle-fusing ATPase n=1 Tax=Echinostoma caproni TaxID=27848 RepID=A0A183BD43_9TREM|nr:unnamed protein product [Echinostoma caproni]
MEKTDISKRAFGTAEEELSYYAPRGIMMWGETVSEALNMGRLAVRAVGENDVETYRPLTLLIEGPPKAGKTALAVEIAKLSGFPFVKILTSHKMIGYTETAKCAAMKKVCRSVVSVFKSFPHCYASKATVEQVLIFL